MDKQNAEKNISELKAFRLTPDMLPEGWSKQAALFINKLLQRNPKQRLGAKNGAADLKGHAWFKGFDWEALASRKMMAPFRPREYYMPPNGFGRKRTSMAVRDAMRRRKYEAVIQTGGFYEAHKVFKDYYYNIEDVKN